MSPLAQRFTFTHTIKVENVNANEYEYMYAHDHDTDSGLHSSRCGLGNILNFVLGISCFGIFRFRSGAV